MTPTSSTPSFANVGETSSLNASTVNHPMTTVATATTETHHPLEEHSPDHDNGTTERQTFIHLVKGYVGPGCLSQPWAFSQLGIGGGIVSCLVLSYWSSYNCWTVLQIKRKYLPANATYPQVGGWAYGRRFQVYVQACICVQQLAICTVFVSFIGENLLAALPTGAVNHATVMTLALPAILGLGCVADLRSMAPFTAAGTALLFVAFGLLGAVIGKEWNYRNADESPLFHLQLATAPLALCAILYSYEGICLILPVEAAMQNKEQFGKVFWSAMATVAVIFCAVAGLSVAAFGDVTNGSITAYLLDNPEYADEYYGFLAAANTFVSLSVLLTYPLQLFPALELMAGLTRNCCSRSAGHEQDESLLNATRNVEEPTTGIEPAVETVSNSTVVAEAQLQRHDTEEDGLRNDNAPSTSKISGDTPTLRLSLVLSTYFIAMVVPNVQLLISLAGALAGSSTALLIPPLIELQYVRRQARTEEGATVGSWCSILRCCTSFLMGFIFMCIGTIAAILDIVHFYAKASGTETNDDDGSAQSIHYYLLGPYAPRTA